jgi:hypothetical protein
MLVCALRDTTPVATIAATTTTADRTIATPPLGSPATRSRIRHIQRCLTCHPISSPDRRPGLAYGSQPRHPMSVTLSRPACFPVGHLVLRVRWLACELEGWDSTFVGNPATCRSIAASVAVGPPRRFGSMLPVSTWWSALSVPEQFGSSSTSSGRRHRLRSGRLSRSPREPAA